MKKQFIKVKHLADQTVGRVEKSEVLSEDILGVEKRVENIKHATQSILKKLSICFVGQGSDLEKRLKKIPETYVSSAFVEYSVLLGEQSLIGKALRFCGEGLSYIGKDTLQYELNLEKNVFQPLNNLMEIYMPVINKFKKQLNKQTLEMDICKNRYNETIRRSIATNDPNNFSKIDVLKEDYEDSCNKLDHIKDAYTTEMFKFLAKEGEISQILLKILESQIEYHRNLLYTLENIVKNAQDHLNANTHKPAFGCPLEEYIDLTDSKIAPIIKQCTSALLEIGLDEVGLFRMAGSVAKVKRLKSALDSGLPLDISEYAQDPHVIASVLKLYLRELPEPLLTYKLYHEWSDAAKMPEQLTQSEDFTSDNIDKNNSHEQQNNSDADYELLEKKILQFGKLLKRLPRPNYNNLKHLLNFFSTLNKHSNRNLMTAKNLAIVLGPNLLWRHGDLGMELSNTSVQNSVIEFLITHYDRLFDDKNNDQQNPPNSTINNDLKHNDKVLAKNSASQNGNKTPITNKTFCSSNSPSSTNNNNIKRKPHVKHRKKSVTASYPCAKPRSLALITDNNDALNDLTKSLDLTSLEDSSHKPLTTSDSDPVNETTSFYEKLSSSTNTKINCAQSLTNVSTSSHLPRQLSKSQEDIFETCEISKKNDNSWPLLQEMSSIRKKENNKIYNKLGNFDANSIISTKSQNHATQPPHFVSEMGFLSSYKSATHRDDVHNPRIQSNNTTYKKISGENFNFSQTKKKNGNNGIVYLEKSFEPILSSTTSSSNDIFNKFLVNIINPCETNICNQQQKQLLNHNKNGGGGGNIVCPLASEENFMDLESSKSLSDTSNTTYNFVKKQQAPKAKNNERIKPLLPPPPKIPLFNPTKNDT